MPKFESSFTFGRGPETAPILNGPSPSVMRVGIGPPPPWVMEYMFHPPPIFALIRAVPLPPAGMVAGATVIVNDTGFCAQIPAENVAPTTHSKMD